MEQEPSNTTLPPSQENGVTPSKGAYDQLRKLLVPFAVILTLVLSSWATKEGEEILPETPSYKEVGQNPFDTLMVFAQSAYILDVNHNEVLYEKNSGAQLPLASVTKLMTALLAAEALEKNRISLESLKIPKSVWDFDELITYTLVTSSNEGAQELASAVTALSPQGKDFVSIMNEKAREIGLSQTYFINPTGLDVGGRIGGGYGSARDVAYLMRYALIHYPDMLDGTRYGTVSLETKNGGELLAENTNTAVGMIPGVIGSKTGTTALAGGNLVIAFDAGLNRPIIISLLSGTEENRFRDAQRLAWATLAYLEKR